MSIVYAKWGSGFYTAASGAIGNKSAAISLRIGFHPSWAFCGLCRGHAAAFCRHGPDRLLWRLPAEVSFRSFSVRDAVPDAHGTLFRTLDGPICGFDCCAGRRGCLLFCILLRCLLRTAACKCQTERSCSTSRKPDERSACKPCSLFHALSLVSLWSAWSSGQSAQKTPRRISHAPDGVMPGVRVMPPGSNNLDGGSVSGECILKERLPAERQQIGEEWYQKCDTGRLGGEEGSSGQRLPKLSRCMFLVFYIRSSGCQMAQRPLIAQRFRLLMEMLLGKNCISSRARYHRRRNALSGCCRSRKI